MTFLTITWKKCYVIFSLIATVAEPILFQCFAVATDFAHKTKQGENKNQRLIQIKMQIASAAPFNFIWVANMSINVFKLINKIWIKSIDLSVHWSCKIDVVVFWPFKHKMIAHLIVLKSSFVEIHSCNRILLLPNEQVRIRFTFPFSYIVILIICFQIDFQIY